MLKDNWEDKHDINLPAHTSSSNNMALQPLQGLVDNDHLTGSSSKINVATLTSSRSNLQDGPSLVDSNLQQLITFLSSNYGPMKTPLGIGTPEYLKLVEILNQSSVNGRGSSVEEVSGALKEIGSYSKDGGTNSIQNVETASLTENKWSPCRNNQAKISSEKAAEQLWEGSLQLSSSVTLSAVAFFKSGEKLIGNNWPEFIEVKGKVRLEAFEKYVQDLPRSRNRGLMVVSICWNEGSSNIGLNGMKEVAKGYKKSSRVGFAHLLSGTDLYICPRSDPIITILAKYGFFKGMSVIDDKPDSMIGCVVWRKNRPSNPVGNTSDGKNSPNLTQPQNSPPGFSLKQGAEKKLSPEKAESSQHDKPWTLPLTVACAEVDPNGGSSSSSSSPLKSSVSSDPCNLVFKKRPFEDDDLPEFDFSVACGKSALVSKPLTSPEILDNSRLTRLPLVINAVERNSSNNGGQLPSVMNAVENNYNNGGQLPLVISAVERNNNNNSGQRPAVMNAVERNNSNNGGQHPSVMNAAERNNNNNGSLKQPMKKTKLFDDDDMPEWCPPELHNQPPPQIATPNIQNLPLHPPHLPPLPPGPPPPRADIRSSFSYQPFRPPISSQPPVFVRPPQPLPPPPLPPPRPPSGISSRFSSNQVLWHRPPFPTSNGRRPQL